MVPIDELLIKVGLSPRLKDRNEKLEGLPPTGGSKPFEVQSAIKARRATNQQSLADNALGGALLMSPGAEHVRNRNLAQGMHHTDNGPAQADQYKKLLHKLNEEKNERKKREELRRIKTLEKYEREAEEKKKVEEETKQRLADEKLKRH